MHYFPSEAHIFIFYLSRIVHDLKFAQSKDISLMCTVVFAMLDWSDICEH